MDIIILFRADLTVLVFQYQGLNILTHGVSSSCWFTLGFEPRPVSFAIYFHLANGFQNAVFTFVCHKLSSKVLKLFFLLIELLTYKLHHILLSKYVKS